MGEENSPVKAEEKGNKPIIVSSTKTNIKSQSMQMSKADIQKASLAPPQPLISEWRYL